MRAVLVWDLPTRLFHWLLVVFVVLAWFTGEEAGQEEEGLWGDEGFAGPRAPHGAGLGVHEAAGYAVLALLVFRVIWGVAGNRHARFRTFLRTGSELEGYVRTLLRLEPPRYLGHNPLGGWMVVILLAALAGAVATGVFAGGGEVLAALHEGFANLLIALSAVHFFGVLVDMVLTRDNLIGAMITGRKSIAAGEGAQEAENPPLWRALIALALALAAAGYVAVGF